MRGADSHNESLFTTVRLEDFIPATHSLRPIRTWVNDALAAMEGLPGFLCVRRPQTPHHQLRCNPLGSRSKCYET